MNQHAPKFLALSALVLVCVLAPALASELDEARRIRGQVFAETGVSGGPDSTLELLESLQSIYGRLSDEELQDIDKSSDLTDIRSEVSDLVEVSQLSEDKCNRVAFKNIEGLAEENKEFGVNVLPYLEHQRRQLFHFCISAFKSSVDESSKSLSGDQIEALNSLRRNLEEAWGAANEEVEGTSQGVLSLTDIYERAILSFLNERFGPLDTLLKSKQDETSENVIESLYINNIEEPCSKISGRLSSKPAGIIDASLDEDLVESLDEATKELILNAKICRKIYFDTHNYPAHITGTVTGVHYKPPLRDRIAHFWYTGLLYHVFNKKKLNQKKLF